MLLVYKEDNSLLRTVVSSQLQHAQIRKLEHLSTELLPRNGCLHGNSLSALFWLLDVMSCHVAYKYNKAL
jgi:hypothetical protein